MGRVRWHFPKVAIQETAGRQAMKIIEEVMEFVKAKDDLERCVEACDILHAVETLIRQNFDNYTFRKAKRIVIAKNEARGYYED
ncbi:hypothetical protein [Deferribacter abyssi]|uniref:hypothetical protein n=1 Tax=Deferribacter abyssi TaxID=213806 RepID=UPI003C17637F